MQDSTYILQDQVNDATREKRPLTICGGGSKHFMAARLAMIVWIRVFIQALQSTCRRSLY